MRNQSHMKIIDKGSLENFCALKQVEISIANLFLNPLQYWCVVLGSGRILCYIAAMLAIT